MTDLNFLAFRSPDRACTVRLDDVPQCDVAVYGSADGREDGAAARRGKPGGVEHLHGLLSSTALARLLVCPQTHEHGEPRQASGHPCRCVGHGRSRADFRIFNNGKSFDGSHSEVAGPRRRGTAVLRGHFDVGRGHRFAVLSRLHECPAAAALVRRDGGQQRVGLRTQQGADLVAGHVGHVNIEHDHVKKSRP